MGGSGGGGSSGAVDYPDYMETQHTTWLTQIDTLIDAALLTNPYDGYSAYDPDARIALMISCMTDLVAYLDNLESVAGIDAEVAAFDVLLQDQIDTDTIPAFEAGMRDINAVQSSSFVIGRALLYAKKDKQVAGFAADLQNKRKLALVAERRAALCNFADVYRLALIAEKEEYEAKMEVEIHAVEYPLTLFRFGSNMMASISGGTAGAGVNKPSKTQTAMAGALSGAASGAMIGGAATSWSGPGMIYGAVIGAVVGGVAGYLSGG